MKSKVHKVALAIACLVSGPAADGADAKGPASTGSSTRKHAKASKVDSRVASLYKQDQFRLALKDFNEKKYGPAAEGFWKLDKAGYCCDVIHYYLAQCYQFNGQLEQATQNYNYVLSYSKDETLRKYSQYANDTLAYYSANRTHNGVAGGWGGAFP